MSSLTRWVLAHKRIVVGLWVALTIAGMAAAGPATDALEPEFSVPDKEGWETNQQIAALYQGTGGDTAPLIPVVTLPEGESVDSPAVRADLERDRPARGGGAPQRARGLVRVDRRRHLRLRRRLDHLRRRLPAAGPELGVRREPRR